MPQLVYASDADCPFSKGLLVRDAEGLVGLLAAVLIASTPGGRVTGRTVLLRHVSGGCEWEADVTGLAPEGTPGAAEQVPAGPAR